MHMLGPALVIVLAAISVSGCAPFRPAADPNAPLPMANSGPPTGKYEEEDADDDFFKSVSPLNVFEKFKEAAGLGPDERTARAAFEQAEQRYQQKQYEQAAGLYSTAASRWPQSPLEEESLFMAGESYFFCDRYVKADDCYAALVEKHKGTVRLDQVTARRFAIARYWQQHHTANPQWPTTPNFTDKTRPAFDTFGHALRVYGKLPLDDPTSPIADDAVMATANAYFARSRYRDADHYYTMLRTDYPKSEHQFLAHLLGLRAKLYVYQGPDYEGKPLEDAEVLAGQLLKQFGNELQQEGELERVQLVQKQVEQQKAFRDWQLAEYYRKLEYHGSARLYYTAIVEKYPRTQLAASARSRLEELRPLPDEPDRSYQWLVDLFPESSKTGPSIAKRTEPATTRVAAEAPATERR